MNKNIFDFYFTANNLKNVVRTGWKEVGIREDKIESVADHVYGTFILAIALNNEKELNLNTEKVLKMILVRELAKAVSNKEDSVISNTKENYRAVTEGILSKLNNKELMDIFEEYESKESKEANFAYKICKFESDLQAKIYEREGLFTIENALEDIKKYPSEIKDKLTDINKASDGWLTFDRSYYDDDLFISLSDDLMKMD